MLPQFGFIVAQAGADSHPPSTKSTSIQPSSQTAKPFQPHLPAEPFSYYGRHPSPSSHAQTPLLPPPLPYMYTSAIPVGREDYYNSNNKYYANDQHNNLNNGYRPLQPISTLLHHPPAATPPTTTPNNSSNMTPHWQDGNYTAENHKPTSTVWSQPHNYQESTPIQPSAPLPATPIIINQPPPPAITHKQPKSLISQDPFTPPPIVAPNDQLDYIYDDPYQHHYRTRWQEEPMELNDGKMLRRIREFNDLMSWMDTEFWEQCDEIYQEKLQSLQDEVISIQQGTHSAFKEAMADIESRCEQTIQNAEYFRNYELSLTKKQFEQEISLLDNEYENERHNLHDMVLQSIEDKRKQIKEDKEDTPFILDDLFNDAYSRVSSRRNLRKRNGLDRNASSSPSRQERRRNNRPNIPHNIHAQPTSTEEDELESEYLTMKGGVATRRQTSTMNQSKR